MVNVVYEDSLKKIKQKSNIMKSQAQQQQQQQSPQQPSTSASPLIDMATTHQMNKFRSYVLTLADPNSKDEVKLKASQEINENFEMITSSPLYGSFLDHSVKMFLKILQDGEPYFIAEYNIQQVRKVILELLHRLPTNDLLRPYVKAILSVMLKLLEVENEENVLVCLKIIIELHKQYRPAFNNEIKHFLQFVKSIYSVLPNHMDKIFEPRPPIKVKDLIELDIPELLKETFTITTIQTEKKNKDGTFTAYNLIPKGILSLKVLQELPIIVVLMYQLYKQSVHQDVSDFIPLIMTTITLQPTEQQRLAENFNKEIFVDFMGAQVKTLSFLAYIIKIYQEVVSNHAPLLVQGVLQLLRLCPMEVANLRRELLIAARHILATDLRNKFVPHMEQLFDEDILLGRGWTTNESLRPLAYSTLADLVHHVRTQLQLSDLARAVHLFSKNVHDDSVATTIQTMSCKLLLNLVDCIRMRTEVENNPEGRDLLVRMLEVFVLKFKTIATIQLPILLNKCKQANSQAQQNSAASQGTQTCVNIQPDIKFETNIPEFMDGNLSDTYAKDNKSKACYLNSQNNNYNVADYRSLVKTLVCGVKTITWGCGAIKTNGVTTGSPKPFSPQETLIFVRLVKWALKALDIYTIQVGPQSLSMRQNNQAIRSKEEKEVLEHFSGVFSMMHPQTFHEVFSTTIEYLVERVYQNVSLQVVPNTLLANSTTSPIFATVLVEFLLERMDQMGENIERSNLYLRLFKLVFGSVSLFPQENENMLRPHLHQIVNRSMELAMSAKEPYNYFLLLRALFRSIGGGSHDLLYQEFLPLLPNLLEGLNRLQSGLHKQHMKDLFVELCLTVPVRLSSLLPYLPMLMDPLVSALNGSTVLISQGLRTLELCVDNLQHDFLYEHIQPVRADLMQALWRTLRNNDQVAQVAFKVLGKFGGGNRKMMTEPQKLNYIAPDYESSGIVALFYDQQHAIEFPVDKLIENAFSSLKSGSCEPFYRKQAWEVIYCYIIASLNFNESKQVLGNLLLHPSFLVEENITKLKASDFITVNRFARDTHIQALTGLFLAAAIKELRQMVLPHLVAIVRHYTIVAVVQQAGVFSIKSKNLVPSGMDPLVLIDALTAIMGHDEKELCKPGELALNIMLHTTTTMMGSKEMACKLPLMEYLAEKMSSLCYERAWFAKLGGCIAINFMFEKCDLLWVYDHVFTFLKALLFVMMDLTGEVSSGALDMAKSNLEKMLIICVAPLKKAELIAVEKQTMALNQVTHELVRLVTSPHAMIREQAMASLRLLAEKQDKTVTAIMEPFRDVLADMIPPKKHVLKHQPAVAQMGLMDGSMFCTSLNPRLFTLDMSIKEHDVFITDLIQLCKSEDSKLTNYACYKGITDFIPLRICALRVLASCHYLGTNECHQIFQVLYKTLEKPSDELQATAFECLKTFIAGFQVSIRQTIRPLLLTLGDPKSLTLNGVKMLSYLTQLFPLEFNEKLCEQLLEILKKLFESLIQVYRVGNLTKKGDDEQKIVTIISIYKQTPAASSKFIKSLSQLIVQAEQAMMIEANSPFRDVLMKFLLRYVPETVDTYLQDSFIKEPPFSRYLLYMLKHKGGKPFRDHIQTKEIQRLRLMVLSNAHITFNLSATEKLELQYQSIRIISVLIKYDDQWLSTQQDLIESLKQVWTSDEFQERHKVIDTVNHVHWREPKLLVKILLHYFCHHPNDIDLLFQLLRAICGRYIPDFQFLKDFLENTIAQNYTVEWKRSAFFRFVEHYQQNEMSQELKAKILQYIIIPCFAIGFERGETNKLVGSLPAPNQDIPDNIVSVFINKIIDPDIPSTVAVPDCIRISLLQFACLLVEQASLHIHDHEASNKAQGFKLRKLMTFAWPCLLGKNCVDPTTRYHGHLLLAHIIDKFAIHRRIVLQVFHSLLKAHAVEARVVVRRALDILTPSMPLRMDEGYTMLMHWTKKIIVDEGHSMQQLFHILQLVVRHYKVYYVVRHHLVQHMVNSIQRLGFNPTATLDHRKLAVELAEVIIKWELYGIKEEDTETTNLTESFKNLTSDEQGEPPTKKLAVQPGTAGAPTVTTSAKGDSNVPIDRIHTDNVLNSLLRLACQVNDPTPVNQATNAPVTTSPGELLSRRCVFLLKAALKPDVWSQPPDLKLAVFDKILLGVESSSPNVGNICTALELLTFLLGVMKKDAILVNFKQLQRGLGACIVSTNARIIKLVHALLAKLMLLFPSERSSASVVYKFEELEPLFVHVAKVIGEGLQNFEKNQQANPSSLFGTLMILKAACTSNNSYIDLMITPFMKVLSRLAKEHLQNLPEVNAMISELLILCLDLVKTRVVVLSAEMRKSFIGTVLVGLIEKSPDIKIMKAIAKILEEWMKNKNVITLSQAPSLREKSILLSKMMQHIEKRFHEESDLVAQFLEIVHYVYTDDQLSQTELTSKLEPAFLSGLRCNQPQIRAKFFKVFDSSMRRKLHDRLMYIAASQNWEMIGSHYWIKQCIELLLATVSSDTRIQMAHESCILPCVTSVINIGEKSKKDEFLACERDSNLNEHLEIKEEILDLIERTSGETTSSIDIDAGFNRVDEINKLLIKQGDFAEFSSNITTDKFLVASAQLCHIDSELAEQVWLQMFPRLWDILDDDQRVALSREIPPFIASGAHVIQKDCHPSAIHTFVEALSRCNNPIQIIAPVMKYIAKSHNLWHRVALNLEHLAFDTQVLKTLQPSTYTNLESEQVLRIELLDNLADLYLSLKEEDLWAGLWQKHAYYKETNIAIAFEQQGFFEQAQAAYEAAMAKYKQEVSNNTISNNRMQEVLMWSNRWIRCAQELTQWDTLLDYSKSQFYDPILLSESAWHVPNSWDVMKEALGNCEFNCPKELSWKITLYCGFLLICNPEERPIKLAEKYVESATIMCLTEWRRLPHIVSHIHLPLLQAAQQVMELQEAYQIHKGLMQGHQNSLHDMKAIIKTWRNRLPVIADDLSHWNDIFTWRQHHYQFIVNHYETLREQNHANSMLGVHASAQSIIYFGKIARKHKLTNICLETLNKIYTITSVPIVDCFQKIRQQVKCYLQMASVNNKAELQEGLEVINNTNIKYFSKEVTAEFYAMKGLLFYLSGKSDEANKSFSAGIQLHDCSIKAWALYGDYLEAVFTKEPRQISLGANALCCFLHACRHQNESKARKYLAKVLWLLSYDDEKGTLMETLDKYSQGIPPVLWVPWIPQLLNCLVQYEGTVILNLLLQVGRMFPQAVYFPIRTLYLTLRTATARKTNTAQLSQESQGEPSTSQATSTQENPGTSGSSTLSSEASAIKATPPMIRCSKIMKVQRDIHTTVLSSLEGIADQMEWFRENWYEEVVRQLRQGLAKCYAIAFENRESVNEAKITPHILNFVKKLVSTFGIGIEYVSSSQNVTFNSAASESLARRAEATYQDPVFQEMKSEFARDFDFTNLATMKLHTLIFKLKKWIKALENRSKMFIQSFLMEEKCRFLSNFTLKTADVELPGEFLLPKHSHYYVKITRFMPRVDIVQKHNCAARRLYIRGHNGKIYPYLVINDSGLADARREERVLQVLRMLNLYLGKQKETSRRFLHFTVPKVVAISQQIRLVEDNPSSISLLDIYKRSCTKNNTEHDAPIQYFYERLANIQSRGIKASHQVYRELLKTITGGMVPRNILRKWAVTTFPNATDYWQFRKMFTLQLALFCFAEYVLHLTRLNPDMMYLHQDSGLINISYYKFDVDDITRDLIQTRPVPFRLTPNIVEFLSPVCINGPLTAALTAIARCLVYPNFKVQSILKTILRDEMGMVRIKKVDDTDVPAHEKLTDNEQLINSVNKAVSAIISRLNNIAVFDGTDTKVGTLVTAAVTPDNLCRMDPAWHPWL